MALGELRPPSPRLRNQEKLRLIRVRGHDIGMLVH